MTLLPVRIVPEMTYKVSSGTLSLYSLICVHCLETDIIPYHAIGSVLRTVALRSLVVDVGFLFQREPSEVLASRRN